MLLRSFFDLQYGFIWLYINSVGEQFLGIVASTIYYGTKNCERLLDIFLLIINK